MKITIAVLATFLLIGGECARGAVTAYEGFDYPTKEGGLDGKAGGIGFTGAWSGSTVFFLVPGSLFGTNDATGNQAGSPAAAFNKDIHRDLASPIGTPGTTTYLSFLLQPSDTLGNGFDSGSFGVILSNGSITSNDLYIGKPGSGAPNSNLYVLEGVGGTGHHASSVVPVSGQSVLMIVRADFTAGVDTFRLYINPPSDGVEPAVANATKADSNISTFSRLFLAGPGSFRVDELKVGTTYLDVVPEPSTFGLLAMGAIGICARRARRRVN